MPTENKSEIVTPSKPQMKKYLSMFDLRAKLFGLQ